MVISKLIAASAVLGLTLALQGPVEAASINAGNRSTSETRPFQMQSVADFDTPWALAFLPDGRMLVTEKPGNMYVVAQNGQKQKIGNVPRVAASGQNGLLDVAPAPDFAASSLIYFTYVEPDTGGSRLVLARARLSLASNSASLDDLKVLWRQTPGGGGGQPGGIIAFDPKGDKLFLSVGDRMQPTTAQDEKQARGKVLRLNLDGSTPSDNPHAAKGGIEGQTWTSGHRNPYGLAFAPDGKLWLHEMGPKGGDELNLIEKTKNYGWPLVSNGDEYSGAPIPRHSTRPEFAAPLLYWNPVIAPAGLVFYTGTMFPKWNGSALIGGLRVQSLVQVSFDSQGQPDETGRWNMKARIRDVAVAPDGAVWLIEDNNPGKLMRLTPAK